MADALKKTRYFYATLLNSTTPSFSTLRPRILNIFLIKPWVLPLGSAHRRL